MLRLWCVFEGSWVFVSIFRLPSNPSMTTITHNQVRHICSHSSITFTNNRRHPTDWPEQEPSSLVLHSNIRLDAEAILRLMPSIDPEYLLSALVGHLRAISEPCPSEHINYRRSQNRKHNSWSSISRTSTVSMMLASSSGSQYLESFLGTVGWSPLGSIWDLPQIDHYVHIMPSFTQDIVELPGSFWSERELASMTEKGLNRVVRRSNWHQNYSFSVPNVLEEPSSTTLKNLLKRVA